MNIPEEMARDIGGCLREVEQCLDRTQRLLGDPKGKPAERLEDSLNELQDASYRARSAFRVGDCR